MSSTDLRTEKQVFDFLENLGFSVVLVSRGAEDKNYIVFFSKDIPSAFTFTYGLDPIMKSIAVYRTFNEVKAFLDGVWVLTEVVENGG